MNLRKHIRRQLIENFKMRWPYDMKLRREHPYTYPKVPTGMIFSHSPTQPDREIRKAAEKFIEDGTFERVFPPKQVLLSQIVPTQNNLTAQNLEDAYNSQDIPWLLQIGDLYYVLDGHHRLANEILQLETHAIAHVATAKPAR